MITYVKGNLFESPAKVLVNTVNTVGVMGKGIAKDFKTIYPEMFREYQKLCETKKMEIGNLWLYKTSNKWILNFPTKTTWRLSSKIEYIKCGLEKFIKEYAERGITSIAFPTLGCGNGELDWEKQVRPLMEKYLKNLPIDVFVYLHTTTPLVPEHRDIKAIAEWLRSEPENLGFAEVWHDLIQLIGSGLSLQTLTNKQSFQAKVVTAAETGIVFNIDNEEHFIPEETLMELWNLIRNYGFGIGRYMPSGLESLADYLVALFSRLPYCRPIEVSTDYAVLNNIGLQFIAKSQKADIQQKLPFELKREEHAKTGC
ncbi:MAG: macro domain-containing protein [Candidatus Schekmanbacteria bacterium]|nr:macro domain-containing protein [Candidatus Schekmanbacteria bacterium]